MKYETTKEFILDAHKDACPELKAKIEKEFPDLFKTKFNINSWYKTNSGAMVCYQGGENSYGFTTFGEWKDIGYHWTLPSNEWTPATDEEVFSMLKKEAEKRVLVDGVTLAKEGINNGLHLDLRPIKGYYFDSIENILDSANGEGWLMKDGKWATIVEQPKEMTLEEIEKQLGHKIKIVR